MLRRHAHGECRYVHISSGAAGLNSRRDPKASQPRGGIPYSFSTMGFGKEEARRQPLKQVKRHILPCLTVPNAQLLSLLTLVCFILKSSPLLPHSFAREKNEFSMSVPW